jgi:putative hydrolase of the HAD superfamily
MPERWVLFDWGDTLMAESGGPPDLPMALWPEVRAIDGAADVLADLALRYRIGVASSASVSDRAQIERALGRVSLAHFVSEIVCRREIGVRKAEATFWDAVLLRTGVRPDRIVMVGDDLIEDVLAPRRSGLAAVWFNWKRAPAPPDLAVSVIERLSDLPAAIGELDGWALWDGMPGERPTRTPGRR